MNVKRMGIDLFGVVCMAIATSVVVQADSSEIPKTNQLTDIRMRDPFVLTDPATRLYYLVGSSGQGVRVFTSKDLATWVGPQMIFSTPTNLWNDIPITGIWAPEMHAFKGKYYLFLTFNTNTRLPEQWRNWIPRVMRGSQVLVSDKPTGPFKPFQNHSTLPADMMTLDGTLWVEDGVPYMVFCHEWVQIKDGTVEYVRLKADLSETDGEPKRLFDGSDAPWNRKSMENGSTVTDGAFLYRSKSGRLFMLWSGFGSGGYTTGIAIAESGKLAGPWKQQAEPVYDKDGGHAMLFRTFDGRLMMTLHCPNGAGARPRIFEMEDTGDTLRIVKEMIGH